MNQAPARLLRFIEWQNNWAVKSRILILALIYPVFPALLLPWVGDVGGAPILDLHLTYDAEYVRQVLLQYDETALANYRLNALTVDFVYPIYYAFLLSLLFAVLLKAKHAPDSPIQYFRALPFLVMIVDWCENFALVSVVNQWPEMVEGIANLAGIFTLAKWVLLGVVVLSLVAIAIRNRSRQSLLSE